MNRSRFTNFDKSASTLRDGEKKFSHLKVNFFALALFALFSAGCAQSILHNKRPFVPDSFSVPEGLLTEDFKLRKLTMALAEADYDAVMESRMRLRALFGGSWPEDDFTLEQNRADLAEHEKAFERKEAFTYTILSLDESHVLGCIYIYPDDEADAQVLFWVSEQAYQEGLEPAVLNVVNTWLEAEWPFEQIVYAGRID